jgi:hypothetical protein
MSAQVTAMAAAVAMSAVVACAPSWKARPHDRLFQRATAPVSHPMPAQEATSDWWDHALHSTVLPLAGLVSPARWVASLVGGPPALDVNAFGQVPDSEWFVNRIGRVGMSAADLRRGAARGAGPAAGPLRIIAGKPEGVTPGVVIRDSAGVVWYAKFDPPAYPELTSGAELVASRLLHAAGYHVPETYLVDIDLDQIVLDPKARTPNRYGRPVRLTERELRVLLTQLNPDPAGKLRALFSRAVPGRHLGPFEYRGVRSSDPNDHIVHERRRSLRGLWVFSAWLNNTDTRRQNTLDTFIADRSSGGHGSVRHYLIDFGDALGAAGDREKYLSEGYEYRVDWGQVAARFAALGLRYPYWNQVHRSPYRGVGIFEGQVFSPERWRPLYPNPAFSQATRHDTYWATAILARFTPELIAAAVEAGRYSEPGAADFITRVLIARRRRLLEYGFRTVLALDYPEMVGPYRVKLCDLEAESGLVNRARARYRWTVTWNRTRRRDQTLDQQQGPEPVVDVRAALVRVMAESPAAFRGDPYLTVTVHRLGKPSAVKLHLRAVRDIVFPVALERD